MISFSQTGGTSGITTISISATSNSELVNLVNDYTLGNGNGHSLLMPIIQKAYVPTEKYITFSPVSMSIGSSGGTASLNVQSNDNWVIVADDWIQLSRFMDIDRGPQTISGDGNTIIGIRLFENIGEARTGTISGYCVSDSSITASTVVSQAGSYVKPYIVLGSYSADVQYNASSYTFSVSSNTSWNVTTDARWITLNTLSGTGNSNVSYSVLANSGEHRRTAAITVFNADEGITANFTLVQEAEQEYPYIKVEPNSFNVSWSGTSGNVISVSANCDYDITTDVAWITTNAASGSGDGSVSFTTLPNSGSSDVGNVVLANSAVSQVVTVQRQAVGKYLSASTNYISSSSTGGTFEVSVYSNVNWSVSVDTGEGRIDTPWLSVTPSSGSNDGSIRISVASGTTEISGSVVLMNFEYDLTYTIDVDREEVVPTILTAIYYTSEPNQTMLLYDGNYYDFKDNIISMEVDGVLTTQDYPGYTFATAGEHVVEYNLRDGSSLDNGAFFDLQGRSMSKIYIPTGMNSIGIHSLYGCYNLTECRLPNGVTEIGGAAISNCFSLTSVTLPNSVSAIGEDFLFGCSAMTSVTIPKNVATINGSGFLYMASSVNEIFFYPTTVPQGNIYIGSVSNTGTFHYPSGSNYSSIISTLPSGWTAVADL